MRRFAHAIVLASLLSLAFALPATAAASWQKGFHLNGLFGDTYDALVYDDGSGRALYLAGAMVAADDVVVDYLVRWDGSRMSPVGGGFNGPVRALAAFDDGSGMALYAGGEFTQAGGQPAPGVARWDGTAWEAVDHPLFHAVVVRDLHVWDDGDGPALYAAGDLWVDVQIGPNEFMNGYGIAKWKGRIWSSLRFGFEGANRSGHSLMDFDDGSGSDLYVVGEFTGLSNTEFANDTPALYVGRWDGDLWSAVGSGLPSPAAGLTVFDVGSGPRLIAGAINGFTGLDCSTIQWNGSAWSQLGGGLRGTIADFHVFDDGAGPKLYAGGGSFPTAPDNVHRRVLVRWQGGNWAPVAAALNGQVGAMAGMDFGPQPGLYFGGTFRLPGNGLVYGLARWDGSAITPVTGAPPGLGTVGSVNKLAGQAGAFGNRLFAGGSFDAIGGQVIEVLASFSGSQWSALGPGLSATFLGITQLAIFGSGSAAELIVAGEFFSVVGQPDVADFARWDGTAWRLMAELGTSETIGSLLPTELTGPPGLDGSRLWLGGDFPTLDGVAAVNVASWDGTDFSALGAGVGTAASSLPLRALAMFDDGNGLALYAAGNFSTAGGIAANRFARWDGSAWTAVGLGFNAQVRTLYAHDDGNGMALYAAGTFTQVDGQPISGLARWDGQAWSSVGGVAFTMNHLAESIDAFATFDDGTGPKLAIGGLFNGPLSAGRHSLVFWDGTSFSAPPGGEPDGRVRSLLVHNVGSGQMLYVGGSFRLAGGIVSSRIAAYRLPQLFDDGFESGDTSAWSSATP
jgi:hypothetical protein